MTLLITVFASIISTILWYINSERNDLRLGTLSLMYWGAALMWFVDAIFEYVEMGEEFFTPPSSDMLNDGYLGLSVVALGLMIWLVIVITKSSILKQSLNK
ncbi:putative membrane-anchored protein [Aequitasia blattaphilus]|uniref:Lycopene cyclase domain-containing protein n=1 Tax=Aequitasia blattaphilus TaxID=2949332 RepID=A0ABT1ECR5_9FIRM|nr:hypothetical protein [Aequitasia blattaphilus]MCP1102262.1 hypothetical protein [Aequitasia blattaphilus]MCR8614902.1 hypothetical protein [Aequitasia blattaphilus]